MWPISVSKFHTTGVPVLDTLDKHLHWSMAQASHGRGEIEKCLPTNHPDRLFSAFCSSLLSFFLLSLSSTCLSLSLLLSLSLAHTLALLSAKWAKSGGTHTGV